MHWDRVYKCRTFASQVGEWTARFTEAPLPSEEGKARRARSTGAMVVGKISPCHPFIPTTRWSSILNPSITKLLWLGTGETADMTVTGEWMQSFVARASFNLGFMHQFGIGIVQDQAGGVRARL